MPPPDSASPEVPGFDEFFTAFVAELLDLDPAAAAVRAVSPDGWPAETSRLVALAGPRYWRRRQDREQRLAANLAAVAPLVTPESLPSFVAERIEVAAPPDLTDPGDHDLCYLKINHGLWEHLYWMFADPDPASIRAKEAPWIHDRYIASGFLDLLETVFRRISRAEGERLRFPGLHMGVSLASGTHDHPDVIGSFATRPPRQQLVIMGAAIGLVAWWETLFPGLRPDFCDGSYPKRGLATGALKTALERAAAASERIVFVVPPHLAAIRLADVSIPQEAVVVPPTTVHESWIPCLGAASRHVLGRLAADGRVLVITQANVFSAPLGGFLLAARRQLLPADARLRFFDLGQALDVAAPSSGGPWARKHAQGDRDLFLLAAE
jgi:hypothetical protein